MKTPPPPRPVAKLGDGGRRVGDGRLGGGQKGGMRRAKRASTFLHLPFSVLLWRTRAEGGEADLSTVRGECFHALRSTLGRYAYAFLYDITFGSPHGTKIFETFYFLIFSILLVLVMQWVVPWDLYLLYKGNNKNGIILLCRFFLIFFVTQKPVILVMLTLIYLYNPPTWR